MTLFLTSNPFSNEVPEGADFPCILNEENGFVERLEQVWKPDSQCLILSADPEDTEGNDEMTKTIADAILFHGLTLADIAVCDVRNREDAAELVAESDVLILSGGHVPTEHAFFEQIHLRELVRDFDGIVIGISAGTMNCAEVVYAQPEREGETLDPDYERFLPGLGLTDLNVLPHYQEVKDNILDGQHLFRDVTCADSFGRCFYALVDGSYILVQNGRAELYGEAYRVSDGEIVPISEEGDCVILEEEGEAGWK